MPEDQGLSLFLQRAGRRDPGGWRRGAAADNALVEGLEGKGRDGARHPRPGGAAVGVRVETPAPLDVIPGSLEDRGPESMNTGLWNMDSGVAVARRPGMTIGVTNIRIGRAVR